jgi:hypothetical protein
MQKRARSEIDREEAARESDDVTWAKLQAPAKEPRATANERDAVKARLQA